jgi:hypothetical protein
MQSREGKGRERFVPRLVKTTSSAARVRRSPRQWFGLAISRKQREELPSAAVGVGLRCCERANNRVLSCCRVYLRACTNGDGPCQGLSGPEQRGPSVITQQPTSGQAPSSAKGRGCSTTVELEEKGVDGHMSTHVSMYLRDGDGDDALGRERYSHTACLLW